jgi:hypothetical protein
MYIQRNSEVRSGKHFDTGGYNKYFECVCVYMCVCVCVRVLAFNLRYQSCKAHDMCDVSIGCVSASN